MLFKMERFAEAKASYLKGLNLDGDNLGLKIGLIETELEILGISSIFH